jgi:hypothetical protein
MSGQLLKTQSEQMPSLSNSRWTMYDVDANNQKFINTASIWHFTDPCDVHDEPEVWTGHWTPVAEDIIIITRKDVGGTRPEYNYKVAFAGSNVFLCYGSDEHKNRVLIGIRNL